MAVETTTLYVQVNRVNVRSAPRIEQDNAVGSFVRGDPLVVLMYRAEQSPDGWVWRQLVESDDHWVAEYNVNYPDAHLLEDTPPAVEAGGDPQSLSADTAIRIRSTPGIAKDNAIETVDKGTILSVMPGIKQLSEEGWVWRKLADRADAWAAEYNARTGVRLLVASQGTVEVASTDEETGQPGESSTTTGEDTLTLVGDFAAPKGRVQTDGRQFLLDGRPFRFIGANLREFPFYARTDILPHASGGNQRDQLNAVQDMKMQVIRMHACHRNLSLPDAIPLIGKALDLIQSFNLLAIVVLNDALGTYWVPGDERFHIHDLGHLDKNAYFHQEGYRENYLPYLKKMVATYQDHPAIFAWELGNEYAIIPQPCSAADGEAFLQFARTASNTIRSLDSNHLITTGLVNTGHVAPNDGSGPDRITFGKQLYAMPNIDFGTIHFYGDNSEEQSSMPDLEILKQVNKPLIVEEWGTPEDNRPQRASSKMEFWIASGAQGFMQWGLSATAFDIGVGDNQRGMDPYSDGNKGYYHDLLGTFRGWAERLAQE